MTKVADIVEFRRDLFFDGAVQIGWFENNPAKRDKAASNFVFHGPEYHGVSAGDISESRSYRLTDTVTFTDNIVDALAGKTNQEYPISLAIAGYGTGKSHLALTLATIFSEPDSEVSQQIIANLKLADPVIGTRISLKIDDLSSPILVIPINGMGNFDLASELSRQALNRLQSFGLDTSAIDDLWPRFQLACSFVERNFDLREKEFTASFGQDISQSEIISKLSGHDDFAFQKVNEIFTQANGYPLRAVGEESPTQLIETLCEQYCGPNKPFQSMLIIFDEFGRFLEFAADRPHIAGDAALQQIYEGVQNNADKCSLLCLNQYELKVYLSRISKDSQSSIQRYITRYDSARKYYLSSNLETLFAHLIRKKDTDLLSNYLSSQEQKQSILPDIQKWFPSAAQQSVWNDEELFNKVIVQGCWPLHPLATWFLCHSSAFLQNRTAITLVDEAFQRKNNHEVSLGETPWSISATILFDSQLIQDLIAVEGYGQSGAVAQSYHAVIQRYQHDFSFSDNNVLLAVLIAAKLGLKVTSQMEAHTALSALSGLNLEIIEKVTNDLINEYDVLEWNERFFRYEIIGDAVPRSAFLTFLKNKIQDISNEKVEEIFSAHCKAWSELSDIDPQFASEHNISTSEWNFFTSCTNLESLPRSIENALIDWKKAFTPDEKRGQLLYCYIAGDQKLETASQKVKQVLESKLKSKLTQQAPILVVLFHDEESKLKKFLAEYSILTGHLAIEDTQRFAHFIEDHKSKILDELKLCCEELTKKRHYCCTKFFEIGGQRLKRICHDLFTQSYPGIIPFPFDGFATTRGNAAKDCRLITTELLTGNLNHDWIATQTPQTQNRASRILRSWDVIGGDGLITMYPRHQMFGRLISFIEDKLKNEKLLNVGQLFKELISPPYGFNIASAGLALGVFLAPRQNTVLLVVDDQDVSPGAWISQAFSGNFLKLKFLDKTNLRYVSDTEAGEWQELLAKWDNELTHVGNLSYLEKSQQLKKRVPLPPGELYERYKRLEGHTQESIESLRSLDKFYEKEARFFENSFRYKDAGNISRIAKDLVIRLNKMENEQGLWVEDQLAPLKTLYSQAREAVIQFFDDWLLEQSCISSQQVPDFRRKLIDYVGNNLRTIELRDFAEQANAHALSVITQIEERQRILYIVNEAQAYLDSHQNLISSQSKIVELRSWIKGAQELVPPLTTAFQQINVPEIQAILRRIDVFKQSCKAQIGHHEKRFSGLWELSFHTLEDIRDGHRQVSQMLSIFVEDRLNIGELSAMQQQLELFEQDISDWNNLHCSNDELIKTVKLRIAILQKEEDDDDELPWDTEKTYDNILNHLLQERQQSASRWFDGVAIDLETIKEMDARTCQINLGKIENPPIYISGDQEKQITLFRKVLTQRVKELQLDGVLAMYQDLPPELQKKFVEIIISKSSA